MEKAKKISLLGASLLSAILISCGSGGNGDTQTDTGTNNDNTSKITEPNIGSNPPNTTENITLDDFELAISSAKIIANIINTFEESSQRVTTSIKLKKLSTQSNDTTYQNLNETHNLEYLITRYNNENEISEGIINLMREYKNAQNKNSDGSISGTCYLGGNWNIKPSWTNPECKVEDENTYVKCAINNTITIKATMNNCKNEGGDTVNGTLTLELVLNSKGKLKEATINFEDISIQGKDKLEFDNLEEKITVDNTNYKIEKSLNGSFTITKGIDNKSLKFELSDAKYSVDDLQYSVYEEILGRYSQNISGGFTIYDTNNNKIFEVKADNLNLYYEYGYLTTGKPTILKIDGSIYEGICSQKWFSIDTQEDIKIPIGKECPTAGKVKINNLLIEATDNGGIIFKDDSNNNTLESFDSCNGYKPTATCPVTYQGINF